MQHGSEEDESSSRIGSASLVGPSLEAGGFEYDREVAAVGLEDKVDCALHAQSLKMSLDQIVKEEDHHGRRLRKEERHKPTTVPPTLTSFAARRPHAIQNISVDPHILHRFTNDTYPSPITYAL